MAEGLPEMSVILVTPGSYEAIRAVVDHLRAQTVHDRLELVIAAPRAADVDLRALRVGDFHAVRIVEVGPIDSTGRVRAIAVRQAAAGVVAIAEDHAFPEPQWAEALIEAHRGPWAAVGPAVINANPYSPVSWADLVLNYGPFVDPCPAGEVDRVPLHHMAVKRAALLDHDQDLQALLEVEWVLTWSLRSRGHRLFVQPAARVAHLNMSRVSSFVRVQYFGGRAFGAVRVSYWHWPFLRRLAYAAAAPAIVAVRLRRSMADMARLPRDTRRPRGVLPFLIVGLIVHTLGEAVGYLAGSGDAVRQKSALEFRVRHGVR